ncbi:acyltransferase family protein [Streptomyces malaysiensis]|uniref:acyltransferase family protein n=1 Tax=Streptomyces malaysiensis TaxID=92644 RepID=UPI0008530EDE|nr:acyltransferase [Streptomyces sp. SPMA113]
MAGVLPRGDRLPSLTGLRFLLAGVVLAGHVLTLGRFFEDQRVYEAADASSMASAAAVSSFFLLSGFVLAWNASPSDTALRFWRRRVVKIFPNHAVTWALMLGLLMVTGTAALLPVPDPGLGEAVRNLLLVHAWVPAMTDFSSVNPVTWSISCEAFFYLLFPLLIRPVRAVPARLLWPVIALVAGAVVTMPMVAVAVTDEAAPGSWSPLSTERWWLIYFFPPVRLLEFILGLVLARAVQLDRWPALRPAWPLLALAAVFAVRPELPEEYVWGAATCLPVAALIPALATRDIQGRESRLGRRGLVLLGEASFALYMVHFPVLYAIRVLLDRRTFDTVTATVLSVAVSALCVAVSLLLWRGVEVPMMRRFARPGGRSTPPARPATPDDRTAPLRQEDPAP